jgi:hypothetical protein
MQKIVDLWDGVYRTAGRFMSYTTTYNDFTYAVAEEDYESGNTATYAQIGALTSVQYLLGGFEERSSGVRISLAPGKANTTGSTSVAVYFWDGSAWTSVGSVADGTSVGGISLARSGVISWNPPAPESEFRTSVVLDIQLYYYKIVFDKTLSADIFIDQVSSVTAQNTKPRIYKFPFMLNERLFLCNSIATKEGNRVDFMAINTTGVLNGDDSSEGIPGPLYFGGADDLVAAISLYNRIGSTIYNVGIFCKAYETYILYTPSNVVDDWRQFTVSKTLGCASAPTMDSAEIGFSVSSGGTEEAKRNIAMWLTFSGPVLFDMAVPVPAWRKIDNYFDKTKAECINFTEIGRSFGFFDLDYSEYNLLIPSGAGQATINKWLVLDLARFRWYEKVPSVYPQACIKVQDIVGKTYHYGLFDDGYMRRLENTYTWDTTSITSIAKTGEEITSKDPFLKSMIEKVKIIYKPTTEITSLLVRHYIDGESTGVTIIDIAPDGVDRFSRKTNRILKGRGLSHAHEIECTTGASSPKGVIVMGLAYKWSIDMEDTL